MAMRAFFDNKWLVPIYIAIKEALLPTRCLVCGSFYPFFKEQGENIFSGFCEKRSSSRRSKGFAFQSILAPFLCPACSGRFIPVESPMCSQCGFMFKSREGEDHRCGECLESPRYFGMARAFGVYDQSLMATIHSFKYKKKTQLARPLGRLLLLALLTYWEGEMFDVVIPVPLHVNKLRERGFNQAFLLVKNWNRIAGRSSVELPFIDVDRHILLRHKRTLPQTGLKKKERRLNLRGSFSVSDQAKIIRKRILLVDDVYTTGATANECAKTLLAGGAARVDILTLARTM